MRPIVFNVGMATYNTAKYLASLLALLAKSDDTIINTPDFINRLKKQRIPREYKKLDILKNLVKRPIIIRSDQHL